MFNRILGNYLVETNKITKAQLKEAFEAQKSVRVRLGAAAVSEKLMTREQADEVNRLQASTDKKFGDIAVEKGYLTKEQVSELLEQQGNASLYFIQALADLDYMTFDEIDSAIECYQEDRKLNPQDIDELMSEDTDRIVKVFLPEPEGLYARLCGVAVRTIIRLIDSGAYIGKGVLKHRSQMQNLAIQRCEGDHDIYTGFAGNGDDLLSIAVIFGQEAFKRVDTDALDAVAEFANCINGLFASALSQEDVSVDMLPPELYENPVVLEGECFCELPVYIQGKEVRMIVAVDSELYVNQTV